MPSVTQGISDFVQSIFNLIAGVFHTIFGAFQSLISAVINLFYSLFNMAEGLVGFVVGNLFILLLIGAVIVGKCFVRSSTMLMLTDLQDTGCSLESRLLSSRKRRGPDLRMAGLKG